MEQPEATTSSEVGPAKPAAVPPKRFVRNQVPENIMNDPQLSAAISVLPSNYSFEVQKTVWRLRQAKVRSLALQFPEGLLLYATSLADIFQTFVDTIEDVVILGDVTYGACCIDDYTAASLGCDFLVHYGHSCLVPVDVTGLPCLYVFVDIKFDVAHLVECVKHNFEAGSDIALAGTIQFASAVQEVRETLARSGFPSLEVPQSKPLSPGEVLGCTAPVLKERKDAIVFVADGRFHLEAIMIANPTVPAFRYDPYQRILTREEYAHGEMRAVRRAMVSRASRARKWGVVLGTLGRQGNPAILEHLESRLRACGKEYAVFLISEMTPAKMALLKALRARLVVLTTAAEEGRVLKENKAKAAAKPKPEAKKRAASSKRKSVDSASGEENDAPTPKRDTARRASAGCGGVVGQLVAMGFDKKKAAEAVKEVGNDTMECVNWLVVNCA